TGPFEAGHDGIESARSILFGDGVDQPAKFTHEPVAEAGGVVIVALDEGDAFADQMREAALAALVAAVDYITVGHQPAQEGLADQIADLLRAPAGDLEPGGRRTQGDPKPAQMATLRPWRLVGVDDPALAQILDQTLDNRLAGETYFSNAAGDAAHRQPYAEPCREKRRDLGARQPVAIRNHNKIILKRNSNILNTLLATIEFRSIYIAHLKPVPPIILQEAH